jgi:hypothetical protein
MYNFLAKIGYKAIEFIQSNIDNSIDINGNAFTHYSFSYWLKKHGLSSKSRSKKGRKSKLEQFNSAWLSDSTVTLTETGAMRASLSIIDTDSNLNTITIGFLDKESATKAFYHNVSGAGKGRIIRQFLGLRQQQEQDLTEFAAIEMQKDSEFLKALLKSKGFNTI